MKGKLSTHKEGDVDFLIPLSKPRQRQLRRHRVCRIFAVSLCLLASAAFVAAAAVYFYKLHGLRQRLHRGPTESDDERLPPPCGTGPCETSGCGHSDQLRNSSGGYIISNISTASHGFTATLTQKSPSPWPNDIPVLRLDVYFEEEYRLRFKIYDPAHRRFEVPIQVPTKSLQASSTAYSVDIGKVGDDFHITVKRNSTGAVLFDSFNTTLVFADQFIQINTSLGGDYIYGLGEHRGRLLHNTSQALTYAFWARDIEPQEGCNLYGSHPFFLAVEDDGNSHGIFLLNSNAMEVNIVPGTPPQLSYTTIGGILDFYVFTGPEPDVVVQQYNHVIGHPYMPPYWALGFHLSRWGYGSAANLSQVIQRNRAYGFPYDTQWSDIDYMDGLRDWTYDKTNYGTLPSIVDDLHERGQHFMIIVDPAISNSSGYEPFAQGMADRVFVMAADGLQPLYGTVWPGTTVFPDFWNPNATRWWTALAQSFHDEIPFDGLWTDMNEPSNFGTGSLTGCPGGSSLDAPPFVPAVCGGSLQVKTICPSALHHAGTHYDLHSLYGLSMATATEAALRSVRKGKRSIVLSRSTFPSSGKYGLHWLGDNGSQWPDLAYSVAGILNFNLFGIPFVGADVCGFEGDTTEELCTRWMQLGAFYPFMRNHNAIGQKEQDPGASWFSDSAKSAMKAALEQRYFLLPHLYTLLARSNRDGVAVARPLFFQYPTDVSALANDRQFLWGDSLMIAPVLDQGAQAISVYFPNDTWYDFATGYPVQGNGSAATVAVSMASIPVYQRGGTIVPVQVPNVTTTLSRMNPFSLLVALDKFGAATGNLYWDDGESFDAPVNDQHTWIEFSVSQNKLTSQASKTGFETPMQLASIVIRGLPKVPTSARVNDRNVPISVGKQGVTLVLSNISLLKKIIATWE